MTTAIVVFARQPRPGTTKSRLIPAVGPDEAACLYARLLARTLNEVEGVAASARYLYVDEPSALPYFERHLARTAWHLGVQCGSDLGTRMANAFTENLDRHSKVVLIGSDILDFTRIDLADAITALTDGHQAVIGPAGDGGYWLLGLRHPVPALFNEIPWGTSTVFQETVRALASSGVRWRVTRRRHDIDTPADLARFAPELAKLSEPAPPGAFGAEQFDVERVDSAATNAG